MAQPTPYDRQFSFQDFQAQEPTTPLPGDEVDGEFNAVKLTIDQTLTNLAKIQRDDGALKNGIVTQDALSDSLSIGFTLRGEWQSGVNYYLGDGVTVGSKFFRATASALSSAGNAPEQPDAPWAVVANFTAATEDAEAAAAAASASEAAAAGSASAAAGSASAASASVVSAAGSADAADASADSAAASAAEAANLISGTVTQAVRWDAEQSLSAGEQTQARDNIGLGDGDRGDLTASDGGVTLSINDGAVSNAKLADMPALTVKANLTGSPEAPSDETLTDIAAALHLLDTETETAIASATVLTATAFGKSFVISGMTAFTVTLPDPTGHAGEMIALRVERDSSAPSLYTLASVDSIDGESSRILWCGESCVLKSTGATWVKIGGFSRPMTGRLKRASDYPVLANVYEPVPFLDADSDPQGLVLGFDSVNGRFAAPRPGKWLLRCNLEGGGASGMAAVGLGLLKNASSGAPSDLGLSFVPGTIGFIEHSATPLLAAGDYIVPMVIISATSPVVSVTNMPAILEYSEVPQW